MSEDPRRFLRYLEAERKAAMLYRSLAEASEGERREALLELADIEDEHAVHWVTKLTEYGVEIPPAPTSLDPDDSAMVARARAAGMDDVLAHLEEAEGADAGMYDDEPEAPASMSADERERMFEERWQIGGFGLLGTFNDLIVNPAANELAGEFVRLGALFGIGT